MACDESGLFWHSVGTDPGHWPSGPQAPPGRPPSGPGSVAAGRKARVYSGPQAAPLGQLSSPWLATRMGRFWQNNGTGTGPGVARQRGAGGARSGVGRAAPRGAQAQCPSWTNRPNLRTRRWECQGPERGRALPGVTQQPRQALGVQAPGPRRRTQEKAFSSLSLGLSPCKQGRLDPGPRGPS